MSSNGNIFRVTGHLGGEFPASPHKGQWRRALMFYLICIWINGWVNNSEAGDLRHQHAHYDVIVMRSWHENGSRRVFALSKSITHYFFMIPHACMVWYTSLVIWCFSINIDVNSKIIVWAALVSKFHNTDTCSFRYYYCISTINIHMSFIGKSY